MNTQFPNTYLQFTKLDDLLTHLRDQDLKTVHLDLTETQAGVRHGMSAIRVFAVVSRNLPDGVAVYGSLIHHALDIDITPSGPHDERGRAARDKFRAEVEERLAKFHERIAAQGFEIKPGLWTHEAPRYLQKNL